MNEKSCKKNELFWSLRPQECYTFCFELCTVKNAANGLFLLLVIKRTKLTDFPKWQLLTWVTGLASASCFPVTTGPARYGTLPNSFKVSYQRKEKRNCHGIRVLKLIKSSYAWPQCNQNSWNLTLCHRQMFCSFCPWCTRGSNELITRLVSLAALLLRKEFNNLHQRKQVWLSR